MKTTGDGPYSLPNSGSSPSIVPGGMLYARALLEDELVWLEVIQGRRLSRRVAAAVAARRELVLKRLDEHRRNQRCAAEIYGWIDTVVD